MPVDINTLKQDMIQLLEDIINDVKNDHLNDISHRLKKCHSESDALNRATDAFAEGDLFATIAFDVARLQLKDT